MYTVTPYDPTLHRNAWNQFLAASRNGTFLLHRDYMDYHAHRFTDASLLIHDRHNTLVALLPATRHDTQIRSHGGLTYGGLILSPAHSSATQTLAHLDAILTHYRHQGIRTLLYKPIPHIYHTLPAEEDLYALFRAGAQLTQLNISSAIPLATPPPFDTNTRRNLNRAQRTPHLTITYPTDLAPYWDLLTDTLARRHNATPVHTLQEIQRLQTAFPESIRLAAVTDGDRLIAGTLLYITPRVIHTQYIAASDRGRQIGALPHLIHHLIHTPPITGPHYLDLGTSNENHGLILNEGLLRQKHGLGARGIAYPTYTITL